MAPGTNPSAVRTVLPGRILAACQTQSMGCKSQPSPRFCYRWHLSGTDLRRWAAQRALARQRRTTLTGDMLRPLACDRISSSITSAKNKSRCARLSDHDIFNDLPSLKTAGPPAPRRRRIRPQSGVVVRLRRPCHCRPRSSSERSSWHCVPAWRPAMRGWPRRPELRPRAGRRRQHP